MTSAEKQRRATEAITQASIQAELFRQAESLHQTGLTWIEARAQTGLEMPHSTFHGRLTRWRRSGAAGLMNHRHPPPSPVTEKIRGFVEGSGLANSTASSRFIQQEVSEGFRVEVSLRTIQEVLQSAGLSRPRRRTAQRSSVSQSAPSLPSAGSPPAQPEGEREDLGGAGLAWMRAASDLTGYGREMATVVAAVAQSLEGPEEPIPVNRSDRDDKGRFLASYNHFRERDDPEVGSVFRSVDEKRADKDLTRLSIRGTSLVTIEKKLLALMALPLVCDKGRFDGVTGPRGEWLQSLDAHDYMPETLSKFARELKWASLSGPLMERHAQLWHGLLQEALGEDASALVLYVDSTSKPYWTDFFHKSGRVAMLGRVMPCLESVLIQTGSGVPLYLKTYAGHVPLVKNVLPLMHEMEDAIGAGMLGRLTVIDGEMNCVGLFRQFDADVDPRTGEKGRYFITPLTHAQVKTLDVIQDLKALEPYRDGDRIGSGWLDLNDTRDPKAGPYRARVIVLERRTKKTFTAYASNAPEEMFSDPVLMDAYFQRWPAQEHVIRDLNGGVAFKAVHGYGKRRVVNITVVDELTKLGAQVERLKQRLEKAKTEEEEAASRLIKAREEDEGWRVAKGALERWQEHAGEKHKEHTERYRRAEEDTKRASLRADVSRLELEKELGSNRSAFSKVRKLQEALAEKEAHACMLASRREIYQTDVELDQILSSLKLGCALLVQYLLHRFFTGLTIDFNGFMREIFELPGARVITPTTETIEFRANRRNPEMMKVLERACGRFNEIKHQRNGRTVRFVVMWPPGSRHAE